jgi:hypothetical protein
MFAWQQMPLMDGHWVSNIGVCDDIILASDKYNDMIGFNLFTGGIVWTLSTTMMKNAGRLF